MAIRSEWRICVDWRHSVRKRLSRTHLQAVVTSMQLQIQNNPMQIWQLLSSKNKRTSFNLKRTKQCKPNLKRMKMRWFIAFLTAKRAHNKIDSGPLIFTGQYLRAPFALCTQQKMPFTPMYLYLKEAVKTNTHGRNGTAQVDVRHKNKICTHSSARLTS